jgi:hypothetical protein
MSRKLYRELMVLGNRDNHDAAVSVPPGKVIEVLGSAQDDRFLRIQVDGEVFEAFECDVTERSTRFRSQRRAS